MSASGPKDTGSTFSGSASAQAIPNGTVLAGRYRIDGLLGIGGMGMVYSATDRSLNIPVALKMLRPELSSRPEAFDRFRQEVLLARQVSSPHVLRIHDIARDDAHWFISMDLVVGEPLDQLLAREGALPVERVIQLAGQVALGLAAAHRQGVVHRDLKPSNVLLDAQGQARIADFGVARSLGTSGLTQAGAVIGTPDYLSPEQARGLPVDARSDLYALGLLIYEMLTGRLPFEAQTAVESLSQRIGGYIIPLRRLRPDAPPWLDRLVSRLLRPQPSQRLQTAEHVGQVLQSRRLATDWRPWMPRLLSVALVVAPLLALAGWWMNREQTPLPTPTLDRVTVMPIRADDNVLDADQRRALTDLLRRDLRHSGSVAITDGDRSEHVFERLGGSIDNDEDMRALQRELPSLRTLRIELEATGATIRASGTLFEPAAGSPIPIAAADDARPASALVALVPAVHRQLGLGASPSLMLESVPSPVALAAHGRGLEHRLRGRIEAAIDEFENALVADPDSLGAALALAETGWVAGESAVTERGLLAAQRIAAGRPDDSLQVLRAQQQGDWSSAERILRGLIERAPDQISPYWSLAEVLAAQGELEAAEATLGDGLERDPGDPRGWFLRGKVAILRGEIRPAVDDYLVRAVLLSKRDRNRFGEAEAVNALGVAYARLGQMTDAEEQYQRGLALREGIGHQRGVASSLRNLAQIAMTQGRRDEAAAKLEQARKIFEQLDDRAGLAAIDNELGLLAEENGDFTRALESYRLALRSRESLGDRLGVAESLNNLGFAQFQRGDYDSARVFWQQSRDAFEQLKDRSGRIRTMQNLGLLEIARGRWNEAQSLLEASLDQARSQQLSEETAVSERNLAELALLRGDLNSARDHIDRARVLFEERGDQRGVLDIRILQARLLLAARRVSAARDTLALANADFADASSEQQGLAALLLADIERIDGNAAASRAALAQADAIARASGVRALQLAVSLRQHPMQPGFEQELQSFGHRPLWLLWLEIALETAPGDAFARIYTDALAALQATPEYAGSWRIHHVAAIRFDTAGNEAAAAQARQQERESLARLDGSTPADLLDLPRPALSGDTP